MTIVLPICFRPGNRRDHSCSAGRKGGWSFSHFVTQESWVAPFVFRHGHEPSTQGPLRDDSKRSPRRALFLKRRLDQLGRSDSAPVSVHIGLLIHGCLARGLRVWVGSDAGGGGALHRGFASLPPALTVDGRLRSSLPGNFSFFSV